MINSVVCVHFPWFTAMQSSKFLIRGAHMHQGPSKILIIFGGARLCSRLATFRIITHIWRFVFLSHFGFIFISFQQKTWKCRMFPMSKPSGCQMDFIMSLFQILHYLTLFGDDQSAPRIFSGSTRLHRLMIGTSFVLGVNWSRNKVIFGLYWMIWHKNRGKLMICTTLADCSAIALSLCSPN